MKGIINHEQVNEEYGLKLTKAEFQDILLPAWLATTYAPQYLSDDEFVRWFKHSKTNRKIAESMAFLYNKERDTNRELQKAQNELAALAIDDYLIKQLNETETFIKNARAVLIILQGVKRVEQEGAATHE